METIKFYKLVKKIRYELEVSQKELANLVGTDQGTISNWELNRSTPTLKSLKNLLKVAKDRANINLHYEQIIMSKD